MVTKPVELTRTTLAVLSIVGLIVVSFLVVRPFLAATVWAATLVVATWPFMRRLRGTFGGRRWAAVTLMTLLLLFLVLLPLSMAISSIATHASRLLDMPEVVSAASVPPPPAWLSDVPLVGRPVAEKWKNLVESSRDDIVELASPYAKSITQWLLEAAGNLGGTVPHLFLTTGIAAILYAKGEFSGVARFGVTQLARKGELAVVIHRLIGKADERIPIDRCVDLPDHIGGERLAEVDAAEAGAELGMQRFVLYLGHAARTSRMQARMQPGTIVFNRVWTAG